MIAFMSGTLKIKSGGNVVVEVNGIGYNLIVSTTTSNIIGNIGESVSLFTYLQIRYDKIQLFGFLTQSELEMFKLLQTIQGIGPKASLSILSVLSVYDIILGITSSDKSIFLKADGIGSRVATRIVSELNDKIGDFRYSDNQTDYQVFNKNDNGISERDRKTIVEDSISAIVNLGYSRSEAYKAVMNANNDMEKSSEKLNPSIEKLVPLALKKLTGN